MTRLDTRLLADLEARGLIAQMTGENGLSEYLSEAPRTLYCGFDPTYQRYGFMTGILKTF